MKKLFYAVAVLCFSISVPFSTAAFPGNAVTKNPAEKRAVAVEISTKSGNGNALQKSDGWQDASLTVFDGNGILVAEDAAGKVKVRGNSTATGKKKPYNIKFSEKTDLFGFGKAKTYCLLANCFDPTLMRNALALDLAKEMELPGTAEYREAEVFMDGVYMGCYQLTEKVEAGKDRVDIDVEKGEFLIECERERVEDGVTYVTVGDEFRFSLTEPETPTEEQFAEIRRILEEAYAAARSGDQEEIDRYFDMDSFAKFYLLNEYFKGIDFAYSSTNFFYKDGKLYAGPVWDFDLSSGNVSEQLYLNYYSGNGRGSHANLVCAQCWYKYLLKNTKFCDSVRRVWRQYRPAMENLYKTGGRADAMSRSCEEIFRKNYTPVPDGGAGWDVSEKYSELERIPEKTLEENISVMKNWFQKRLEWLGGVIEDGKLCEEADRCLWIH